MNYSHNFPDAPGTAAFPIAKAGIPYLAALAFATLVCALAGLALPAFLLLCATVFVAFFFRDPERVVPGAPDCVVSPADGRVVFAGPVQGGRYVSGPCIKVSIFMSVFNVHVNRNPVSGTVANIDYNPGQFFRADLDKASEENEQNAVTVDVHGKGQVCYVQIAGLVARRILCGLKPGDRVEKGARYGMICFGSRLDVYLPQNAILRVRTGERVRAGTTVIGELP
jgi:phosphatidylserine decarboxylase